MDLRRKLWVMGCVVWEWSLVLTMGMGSTTGVGSTMGMGSNMGMGSTMGMASPIGSALGMENVDLAVRTCLGESP